MLIQRRAPMTAAAECVLPAGTFLVAVHDQLPHTEGFSCRPIDYEGLLPVVVPEDDRSASKFDGYYFVLLSADIGHLLERRQESL